MFAQSLFPLTPLTCSWRGGRQGGGWWGSQVCSAGGVRYAVLGVVVGGESQAGERYWGVVVVMMGGGIRSGVRGEARTLKQ